MHTTFHSHIYDVPKSNTFSNYTRTTNYGKVTAVSIISSFTEWRLWRFWFLFDQIRPDLE